MRVLDIIAKHYSVTTYNRSDRQLRREKYLLPGVTFNRFLLLPAAVLIQICCGSLYAWSGYNLPLEAYVYGLNGGIDRGTAPNVFYVAVAFFGLTAAVLGPWLERNGPRKAAVLGATLFYFGNLLTALGVYTKKFPLIFFGYGFVGGAGLGISYISPVSPLQKWFPDHRGLAAGLAVCGFGAGSIFSPYTQKGLIGPTYAQTGVANLGVPKTFIILGSCYFAIMTLAAMVLRMPPPGYSVKGIDIHTIRGAENIPLHNIPTPVTPVDAEKDLDTNTEEIAPSASANTTNAFAMTLQDSLSSREYILMYFMFMCNEIVGLLIISKVQNIVLNQFRKSGAVAASVNSIQGGLNLAGRLVVPVLSDLLGSRKVFFILSTIIQTVLLSLIPGAIDGNHYEFSIACFCIIAFFYGGGFGLIPAFLADQFGAKNVGATHGIILTAWAIGAVAGGLTFTKVFQDEVSHLGAAGIRHYYDLNFRWLLAFTSLGVILALFIPTNLRDRRITKQAGERFRIRTPFGLYRVINFTLVKVTKQEEDTEWAAYVADIQAKARVQVDTNQLVHVTRY